jgi:hypothetical protein
MASANPFAGPRPLTLDDRIYGRDREIGELRHQISAERIVLLHSPSGAGKSSLINAGLSPELSDRFDVWTPTRVNAQPTGLPVSNRYVWSAVMGFEQELPQERRRPPETFATVTLKEYVKQRPRRQGVPPNILLIFDQFEEVLRLAPADSNVKREFFRQLGEMLIDPGVWALLVLREDYLALLDPYAQLIPTHFRNRYRLELLSREQAKESIGEIALTGGRSFTEGALNELVANLAATQVQSYDGSFVRQEGEYVEPLLLQVACRRLWDDLPEVSSPEDSSIRVAEVRKFGDLSNALSCYYADVVHKVAADSTARERAIREWIGERLIRDGVRDQVRKGAGSSEGLDNQLIDGPDGLVDSHLLRNESHSGVYYFELSHDRLLEPVRENNREWFDTHLNKFQKVAKVWDAGGWPSGMLVVDEELAEAQRWARTQTSLTAGEVKFLAASVGAQAALDKDRLQARRERQLAIIARVWAAAATLGLVIALFFYFDAKSRQILSQARNDVLADGGFCGALAEGLRAPNWTRYLDRDLNRTLTEGLDEILQGGDAFHDIKSGTLLLAHAPNLLVAANGSEVYFYGPSFSSHSEPSYTTESDSCKIMHLAVRPDGTQIAVALSNGEVVLKAVPADGSTIKCTAPNDLLVKMLAFSRGNELAVVRNEGIEIAGKAIEVNAQSLAFHPKEEWFAFGKTDGTVSGRPPEKVPKAPQGMPSVTSLAWGPQGLAAASDNSPKVFVWNEKGEEDYTGGGLTGVASVAFSPEGSLLAARGNSSDYRAVVWRMGFESTPLVLRTPTAKTHLTDAVFLDDHDLVVVYENGRIRVFPLDLEGVQKAAEDVLKSKCRTSSPTAAK